MWMKELRAEVAVEVRETFMLKQIGSGRHFNEGTKAIYRAT